MLTDLNSADGHIVCWLANVQFLGDGHVHRSVSKLLAASEVIAGRQGVLGPSITSGAFGARLRLKWDEEERKHGQVGEGDHWTVSAQWTPGVLRDMRPPGNIAYFIVCR